MFAHAHGDLHERILQLTQQIKNDPTNAVALLQRANLEREHGNLEAARRDVAAAEKLRPDWASVALQRARIEFAAGQFADANEAVSACLARDAGNVDALVIRARCQAALGQLNEAVSNLTCAIEERGSSLPDLYLERARIQADLGLFSAAAEGLNSGLRRIGNTPSLSVPAIHYQRLSGAELAPFQAGSSDPAIGVHQDSANSPAPPFASTESGGDPENLPMVIRGPYLQLSSPTNITLRWRTDIPSSSRVIYGTNLAESTLTHLDSTPVTDHSVTLIDLMPDTRYYYAVGDNVSVLAGPDTEHFFLTHPWPGTQKSIRVWVVGDAGTKNFNQQAVRDAFYDFNGTNTVHAWLQLGDNAYNHGSDADYQWAVFNMYAAMLAKSVTWATLGNHDTSNSVEYVDGYTYFNVFDLPTAGEAGGVPSGTEHYYSFDLGMVHFVCLDSMTASRARDGAMAIWLEADLAVNTNRWTVAYWHHPPYSRGSHDSDLGGPGYNQQQGEMRENFLPILEAGGVDLVLCGHSHSYERSMLINGHYGLSDTFDTNTMAVQTGSGRETNGVGAYLKPDGFGVNPIGGRGAVYAVAGSSGQVSAGALNHPVMVNSQAALGSMVLDFSSNRLDATFLPTTGIPTDWFTMLKEPAQPPILGMPTVGTNGMFQFSVWSSAQSTNIVEAASSLAPATPWVPIGTNVSATPAFRFLDTNQSIPSSRYYRVHQP